MIEGRYGQHSATGKWFAEIYHPEFGPITQWADTSDEATRRVELYVTRYWDPHPQGYEWTPYGEPIMAGLREEMRKRDYAETVLLLAKDPIIHQIAEETPDEMEMTTPEGEPIPEFAQVVLDEYQKRGGIYAKYMDAPAEAILRIKGG